jgi:hypothetical protein
MQPFRAILGLSCLRQSTQRYQFFMLADRVESVVSLARSFLSPKDVILFKSEERIDVLVPKCEMLDELLRWS